MNCYYCKNTMSLMHHNYFYEYSCYNHPFVIYGSLYEYTIYNYKFRYKNNMYDVDLLVDGDGLFYKFYIYYPAAEAVDEIVYSWSLFENSKYIPNITPENILSVLPMILSFS